MCVCVCQRTSIVQSSPPRSPAHLDVLTTGHPARHAPVIFACVGEDNCLSGHVETGTERFCKSCPHTSHKHTTRLSSHGISDACTRLGVCSESLTCTHPLAVMCSLVATCKWTHTHTHTHTRVPVANSTLSSPSPNNTSTASLTIGKRPA